MIAEQMLAHLQAQGVGTQGADLFVGFQPDSPHDVVTLFDETGPVEPYHNAFNTDTSGLQVLVRGQDYRVTRDRSRSIHRLLAGLSGDVAGVHVVLASIETPPTSIGQDERGRPEWTAHYRFTVKDPEPNAFRQST